MSKLYAYVSPGFDADSFSGLLLAAATPEEAEGFTELGWETGDGSLVEVVSRATRIADEEDVIAAAAKAGIRVYDTYDDYERETGKNDWDEDDVFVLEHKTLNRMLESPVLQRALEAAGFDCVQDLVVVTNYEVEFAMFWKGGTFEASPAKAAPRV